MKQMMIKAIAAALFMLVVIVLTLSLTSCSKEQLRLQEISKSLEFKAIVDGVSMSFVKLSDDRCQLGNGFDPAVDAATSSVTIPAEVEGNRVVRVASKAFSGCTSLNHIESKIIQPIEIAIDAFPQAVLDSITLFVPRCTWNSYKKTAWNQFARIIESKFYTKEGCELYIKVLNEEEKTCIVGDGINPAVAENTTYVNIPNTINGYVVREIARYAFRSCKLKSVSIPSTVNRIGEYAFASTELESVILPKDLTQIEDALFESCKHLALVSIPEGVKSIGWMAFYNTNLTQVTLPETLEELGRECFSGCPIRSISIPKNVKEISSMAFSGCRLLSDVDLQDGLVNIGRLAFDGCSSLQEISLPRTLQSIGRGAFQSSHELMTVQSFIETPFELPADYVFSHETYKGRLLVPAKTKEKYQTTEYWSLFENILEEE